MTSSYGPTPNWREICRNIEEENKKNERKYAELTPINPDDWNTDKMNVKLD
tara:strand:+ start:738 stop:890 length:153 start_codon:yes stop_codon:yes gene_type:complete